MDVTVTGTPEIISDFDNFGSKAQRAIVRALNRGILAAETQIGRDIAKDTGIKVSDVRSSLRSKKATLGVPEAKVAAGLKRIPLIKFGARGPEPSRGRGRGVTFKLAGSRGRLEHAFIATMPTGHRGVFLRAGRQSSRNPKREAIEEKFGPSLGHVFAKYRAAALRRGQQVFAETLDREIAFRKTR